MRDQLLLESSSRAVNLCARLACTKTDFVHVLLKQSFPSVNSGFRANTPCHLEMQLSGETKTTILRRAEPRSDCLNSPSCRFLFTVGTVFDYSSLFSIRSLSVRL